MNDFKSEVLPSANNNTIYADGDDFVVYNPDDECIVLTKSDIARMYGIAFPEKRRSGECYNLPEQTDVPDINVGDIPLQPTAGDKYEENVLKIAEEMAKDMLVHMSEIDGGSPNWVDYSNEDQQSFIDTFKTTARHCIDFAEKSARAAYEHCNTEPVFNPIGIEKHLIERGLIPAPESFHCNNKGTDKDICVTQCDRCKVSDYHFQ